MARSPLLGMLWMAIASALFATMNILVRMAAAKVPWIEVAAARSLIGALVAVGVAVGRGAPLAIRDRRLAWARSIFGTGGLLCGFFAMGAPAIALGDAVTLASLSTIFIALLSPSLLGEKSGKRVWAATVVAFAGVALVAGPTFHIAGHLAAIATLGALFSAMAMVWLRKLGASSAGAVKDSPEAIVVHFSLVAAVATTVLALPVLRAPDAGGALMLAATGVTGGLAQIAMTRAYALEQAARVSPIGYLGIVLTHVLGAALLGEEPTPAQAIGAALVIGAGLLLAAAALRDARAAAGGGEAALALAPALAVPAGDRDPPAA